MSRYTFDPIKNELLYSKPAGAEIPDSAFRLNADPGPVVVLKSKTSNFLKIMVVILVVLLILVFIYLVWLWFIKTEDQSPTAIFPFI